MDGCENNWDLGTVQINNLLCSSFVCVQQRKMEKKYDQITYLLQLCYWIPLRLRLLYFPLSLGLPYIITYTDLTKAGGWRCIQAHRGPFRNIASGLHFSSNLQSRLSAKFLYSYPQFLQSFLYPLSLDVIPPGVPPAPSFPCGFGPIVQEDGDKSSQY